MSEHHILIVEDQEDLAELYKTALGKAGYKVRTAYTGEEAIAEFKADGADLILLDMTLPEIPGLQVLTEIRGLNAGIPIIVITGEVDEITRVQCMRLGVHDYLLKPVDYHQILRVVEHALKTPATELEIVTLRLPSSVVQELTKIDPSLERAIIKLCEGTMKDELREKDQCEKP